MLLLVSANIFPSALVPITLIMEVMSSSEKSVPTLAAWRHTQEDGIIHSHRHENMNITL
jgi:hypothetical protein